MYPFLLNRTLWGSLHFMDREEAQKGGKGIYVRIVCALGYRGYFIIITSKI